MGILLAVVIYFPPFLYHSWFHEPTLWQIAQPYCPGPPLLIAKYCV
jgi:hypothetical protein